MIELEDIRFRYATERFVLGIEELSLPFQEPTAIIGHSGCGKTTLLRLVAGILRPQRGRVRVSGEEISSLSERDARSFRIRRIGLIFQELELLDYLTAAENILLPFRVSSSLSLGDEARTSARDLAERTGIAHLMEAYPTALSQGERQRVAICRALVTRPELLLADEPTGSLDPENQQRIVALLRETAASAGAGLVMVTHEHQLLDQFERVIDLPTVMTKPS